MKLNIWYLTLTCVLYIKLSEAQVNRGGYIPQPTPTTTPQPRPSSPAPSPKPNSALPSPSPLPPPPPQSYFDRVPPKCYPETAKAYFLPAPPGQPKVTILDPNDLPSKLKEIPMTFKEQPMTLKEKPMTFKEQPMTLKEQPMNVQQPPLVLKEQPLTYKEATSNFKEAITNSQMVSKKISNRPGISPPPAYVPVLPDLIDEVPAVQDRYSRLAESDVKVCNTCASLIEKLPIFKFDQELLDGFLAGLGL